MISYLPKSGDKFKVVISNYSKLTGNSGFRSVYLRQHWKFVILDEGHQIKNHSSSIYEACTILKREYGLIMTGIYIHYLNFILNIYLW